MNELTDQQILDLESDLLALQDELQSMISGKVDAEKIIDLDLPIGRLTRMDAMQQQKMEEAGQRQAKLRLSQIKTALRMLKEEEYGACRICEEPIGFDRLKARPEAPFCLPCQTAIEKKGR